jgi:pimeloyl-ACP methyl ester carboxylesterase
VLGLIDTVVEGPVTLVGSSMGGWIALLVALLRPTRVAALVGVAAAPDFTDWGFTSQERATLAHAGRLERTSDYGPEPTVTTRAFWESGQANLLLAGQIEIDAPVRLIQGQCDSDVPWRNALTLVDRLRSRDVQTILVKDGDHRLSRPADIALILHMIEALPI